MATRVNVKAFRDRWGLSQPDLAKRISVDARTISRWENGATAPSPMAKEHLKRVEQELKDATGRSFDLAHGGED